MKYDPDIRSRLIPLKSLDIEKCKTVGKTVEQMENCAIGARMVGEAARTVTNWLEAGKQPRIIFDNPHPRDKFLNATVESFALRLHPGIINGPNPINSEFYAKYDGRNPVIVLGGFQHAHEDWLFERGEDEAIFINDINQTPPWVRGGHYKGFVNADPRLVVPLLYMVFLERIQGEVGKSLSLIDSWGKCGGVGLEAAHGFDVFRRMVQDPEYTVIGAFSGILTMAQMGGLISRLIDKCRINAVVSTGALIGHGLVEGLGLKHFKHNPCFSDKQLAAQKGNRIYDTIEWEENLDFAEEIIRKVLEEMFQASSQNIILSPSWVNYKIGQYLDKHYAGYESILRSAYHGNIPVFIPAFWDSEVGNDFEVFNRRRLLEGLGRVAVDPGLDNEKLINMALNSKKLAIFSLGAGVPFNWTRNVAPLIEIMSQRLNLNLPEVRYTMTCRVCPDREFLGHLSGSTDEEGESWRKNLFSSNNFAHVHVDSTVVFPVWMAAMEELQSAV
jgi:deoxyhypusine synthase